MASEEYRTVEIGKWTLINVGKSKGYVKHRKNYMEANGGTTDRANMILYWQNV